MCWSDCALAVPFSSSELSSFDRSPVPGDANYLAGALFLEESAHQTPGLQVLQCNVATTPPSQSTIKTKTKQRHADTGRRCRALPRKRSSERHDLETRRGRTLQTGLTIPFFQVTLNQNSELVFSLVTGSPDTEQSTFNIGKWSATQNTSQIQIAPAHA